MWTLVVEYAVPVKPILLPLPIIGQFARLIVEFSVAIHPIHLPLPIIQPSILIIELPFAMPHPIDLLAFIPGALLEGLHDVSGHFAGFLGEGVIQVLELLGLGEGGQGLDGVGGRCCHCVPVDYLYLVGCGKRRWVLGLGREVGLLVERDRLGGWLGLESRFWVLGFCLGTSLFVGLKAHRERIRHGELLISFLIVDIRVAQFPADLLLNKHRRIHGHFGRTLRNGNRKVRPARSMTDGTASSHYSRECVCGEGTRRSTTRTKL